MIRIIGITRDLYKRLDLLFGRIYQVYNWCSIEYIEEDTRLYTITLSREMRFTVLADKARISYTDKGGLEFSTNEFIEIVIA